MRDLTNENKIIEFFKALGRRARNEARVYLTGGATAVLTGWRDTTFDIDMKFEPELDEIYRALPELKEKLGVNIDSPRLLISFRYYLDGTNVPDLSFVKGR